MQEDNVDEPNAVAEGLRGWRGSALIDKARERFEKQEHGRSRLGYGAVAQFAALDRELQLIPRLAADIREQLATLTDDWILVFRNCDHDQLAFVTLDSLLTSIIRRRTGLKAWIGLGRAAHGEAWAAGLLIDDKTLHKRISKINDPRKRAIELKRAGYKSKEWSEEQAHDVGNWLINCCLSALPDLFKDERGPRGQKIINVREEAKELAAKLSKELIGRNPVLYPCTSPPKPWNGWRDGGYHDERTRASVSFVKGKAARNKETEQDFRTAFRNGSMKQHVDGVNQLQSVPFKINEHVLDALKRHGRKLLEEKFRNRSQKLVGKKLVGAERQLEQDKLQLERSHRRALQGCAVLCAAQLRLSGPSVSDPAFQSLSRRPHPLAV